VRRFLRLHSWNVRKLTISPGLECGSLCSTGEALQCATDFDGSNPFATRSSSCDSSMVDGH
jgi:hypothetical protein